MWESKKQNRINESRLMKCGKKCKIIEYKSSANITVEFEDGEIIKNKEYAKFLSGYINNGKPYINKTPENIIGRRFDNLFVLSMERKERDGDRDRFIYYYNCKCDCGNEVIKTGRTLRNNNGRKSCGKCCKIEDSIFTKFPEANKYFKYINDALYSKPYSTKRVWFVCPNCKTEKYSKISDFTTNGFCCPSCSDNISYSEKFMRSILNQLDIEYDVEKTFDWSNKKRYDFYIPSLNCIIETNGIQHYRETSFERTLEEEQDNDEFKENVAIKNGIKYYIKLNCLKSDMNYIIESIKNSDMNTLFDLKDIDFIKCEEFARKTILLQICDIYNNMENKSTSKIGDILKINSNTVAKYLKIANNIGLCVYDKTSCKLNRTDRIMKTRKIKCIEIDKEFNSIADCRRFMLEKYSIKFGDGEISTVCSGKRNHAHDYHFEYIED